MSSFLERLDAAAGSATCQMLSTAGQSLVGYGAVSLAAAGTGLVPLSLGAAALVAANYGCTWDPEAPGPSGVDFADWCWDTVNGRMAIVYYNQIDIYSGFLRTDVRTITSITETGSTSSYGAIQYEVKYINTSGSPKSVTFFEGRQNNGSFRYYKTQLRDGSTCGYTPGPPGPDPGPYPFTDPDSNCEINVTLEGWAIQPGDISAPVWKIEPAPSSQLQAGGGIIGGCNFNPVLYYSPSGGGGGGDGNGPTYIPYEPGPNDPDGNPWWKVPLAAALGGAVGAAVALLTEALLSQQPGGTYELKGVCERDPNGHPMDVTKTTNFPPASGFTAVVDRLDCLADMFQFDKDLRQPTCMAKQKFEGELVTVNFVSDKASPGGDKPLRKVFRYRDQTGSPLLVHLEHWESFTWQAGPVIVVSTNLSWGTPKVWAASIQEGKRVIGHAAQVAGVDLTDPNHKWLISGTNDPRYGQTGTMRLSTRGGKFCRVTKRPEPSGLPYGYSPDS